MRTAAPDLAQVGTLPFVKRASASLGFVQESIDFWGRQVLMGD